MQYNTREERLMHNTIETKEKFEPLILKLDEAIEKGDVKLQARIIKEFIITNDATKLKYAVSRMDDKEIDAIAEHLRKHYQEPPKTELDLSGFSITIGRAPDKQVEDAPKLRIDKNTR